MLDIPEAKNNHVPDIAYFKDRVAAKEREIRVLEQLLRERKHEYQHMAPEKQQCEPQRREPAII